MLAFSFTRNYTHLPVTHKKIYPLSCRTGTANFLISSSLIVPSEQNKWAASREKVPNALCRCHTKRRTCAAPCASPCFGMTTTKDIRDLFA